MGDGELKEHCCGVWLGPARNVTPFHYDLCHGFLAGVRGRKTFTLVHPDEHRCMHARPGRPELSRVDYEAMSEGDAEEHRRHPRFAEATLLSVEVDEGDVLYTPPFWWHHVETAGCGPAVSVLVPFDPLPDEPIHVCHLR